MRIGSPHVGRENGPSPFLKNLMSRNERKYTNHHGDCLKVSFRHEIFHETEPRNIFATLYGESIWRCILSFQWPGVQFGE